MRGTTNLILSLRTWKNPCVQDSQKRTYGRLFVNHNTRPADQSLSSLLSISSISTHRPHHTLTIQTRTLSHRTPRSMLGFMGHAMLRLAIVLCGLCAVFGEAHRHLQEANVGYCVWIETISGQALETGQGAASLSVSIENDAS